MKVWKVKVWKKCINDVVEKVKSVNDVRRENGGVKQLHLGDERWAVSYHTVSVRMREARGRRLAHEDWGCVTGEYVDT